MSKIQTRVSSSKLQCHLQVDWKTVHFIKVIILFYHSWSRTLGEILKITHWPRKKTSCLKDKTIINKERRQNKRDKTLWLVHVDVNQQRCPEVEATGVTASANRSRAKNDDDDNSIKQQQLQQQQQQQQQHTAIKNGISPVNTAKPEIRPNHCHQEAESQPLTGGLTPLLLLSSLLLPRNNYSTISSKPIQLLAGLSLRFLSFFSFFFSFSSSEEKPEFLRHESED